MNSMIKATRFFFLTLTRQIVKLWSAWIKLIVFVLPVVFLSMWLWWIERSRSFAVCYPHRPLRYLKRRNKSVKNVVKCPIWKEIYREMHICWMNWSPWDDANVVWAGKLRKLWSFLSEMCSSFCARRLEKTVLRTALLTVKTAHFTQFSFGYDITCKIAQFNWECIGRFT